MKSADANDTELPVSECHQAVHLPLGLLGFERVKEWQWIVNEAERPFRWLQAAGDPSLVFLTVPAFDVLPDYRPEISDDDVAFLGLEAPDEATIFGIVTLRRNGRASVNLKGPIVLNRATGRGKQVVLVNAAAYSLQHPLLTSG